jgi:hypothetical protein
MTLPALSLPLLLATLACLAGGGYCYWHGWPGVAFGLVLGCLLALAYLLGLRRMVGRSGQDGAGRLKLVMSLRMLSLALVFVVLGFVLPRALWGFLIAFSIIFTSFVIDLALRRPPAA